MLSNCIRIDIPDLPEYAYAYFDQLELSDKTVHAYAGDIRMFFEFLLVHKKLDSYFEVTPAVLNTLRPYDVLQYLKFLRDGTLKDGRIINESDSCRARRLSALRNFMQHLMLEGIMDQNVARLVDPPKNVHRKKKIVSDDKIQAMLDNIDSGVGTERQQALRERSKLRDRAIVLTFVMTGITMSELVNLDVQDIDYKNKTIQVLRKNGTIDILPVPDDVIYAIDDYVKNERFWEDGNFALFTASRLKNHHRLSVNGVNDVLKRFSTDDGTGKHLTAADLRRTYGANLLTKTNDPWEVAKKLGHKDATTVENYYFNGQ